MLDKLMQHGVGVGGGSNIKSIQRGVVVFNNLNDEVTISKVDLDKSIVIIKNKENDSYYLGCLLNGGYLESPTKLKLYRDVSANNRADVYWEVVEFNNVKSIQQGVITPTTNNFNIPISVVNPKNSLVFLQQTVSSNAIRSDTYYAAYWTTHTLNSTDLIIHWGSNRFFNFRWQVIEFN